MVEGALAGLMEDDRGIDEDADGEELKRTTGHVETCVSGSLRHTTLDLRNCIDRLCSFAYRPRTCIKFHCDGAKDVAPQEFLRTLGCGLRRRRGCLHDKVGLDGVECGEVVLKHSDGFVTTSKSAV